MSVDIKDYRKFTSEAAAKKAMEEPTSPELLNQAAVANDKLTGNEHFDKLLRIVQSRIESEEAICAQIANQAMGAVKDEDLRKCQLIYAYKKGLIAAWIEAAQVPAQIITESKLMGAVGLTS